MQRGRKGYPNRIWAYQDAQCYCDDAWQEPNDRCQTIRRMGANTLRLTAGFLSIEAPEMVQNEAQLQCAIEAIGFV